MRMHRTALYCISRTSRICPAPCLSSTASHYTERVTDTETEFGQRNLSVLCWHCREKQYVRMEEKKKLQTRRVLSLKERIDVIRIAETLRDTRELSRQFDCGRTQILSILQQKDRLLKEWANNGDPNRLRRRPSSFAVAINRMVAEWINRGRSAQLSLTDRMIMEKAYQAKKFFKYNEFRPNKRWLDRFKRRFRFDDIDLETPDPSLSDSVEKSMKLSDIFEDIKDTLESSIVDTMIDRKGSMEYKMFLVSENNCDGSSMSSLKDQTVSSNNEISEADDDELTWQLENFCETEIVEEAAEPIKNDTQALECLKRLEEYSMLKENYRAIGLIGQLEQLYKGKLEA